MSGAAAPLSFDGSPRTIVIVPCRSICVRIILVESPDRFARDLAVQLAGHDYLKALGVELIPAIAPDFFIEDTPTAVLVRQVLGAIAQFEKASLVAKLRAARERKKAAGGRGSGRFTYAQRVPATVALAKELHGQRMSLREISAALAAQGHVTGGGKPYTASAVQTMLHRNTPPRARPAFDSQTRRRSAVPSRPRPSLPDQPISNTRPAVGSCAAAASGRQR